MERGRRTLVQALDVVPAEVGEPEASAGERHADLPRVQVARNNEMKRPRTELVDDTREVAEQDAQVRLRVGEPVGFRRPSHVRARVDTGDLDPATSKLDRPRVVREQGRRSEVPDPGGPRE